MVMFLECYHPTCCESRHVDWSNCHRKSDSTVIDAIAGRHERLPEKLNVIMFIIGNLYEVNFSNLTESCFVSQSHTRTGRLVYLIHDKIEMHPEVDSKIFNWRCTERYIENELKSKEKRTVFYDLH